MGLGSLAIAALSAELIVHLGWRETMWWFGLASMVVLIPINILFHRHSAERIGLAPDGPSARPAAQKTTPPRPSATVGNALRTRAFWLLAAGKVEVEGLITHRLPLERLAEGVELMRRREALKVYVTP